METFLVLLAIGAGTLGASLLMLAASSRERSAAQARREMPTGRAAVGAALLREIATAGGASPEVARPAGGRAAASPLPGRRIDLASWAEGFAHGATEQERRSLLEDAVRLAVSMNAFIPARQYAALQDLAFGLGFRADALARLRARWRFEYADYARMSRPAEADRGSGGRKLDPRERASLMKTLGLAGELDRAALISAYRRLAGLNHPDRVHDRGDAEREAASRRFIEITEAYERLLGQL